MDDAGEEQEWLEAPNKVREPVSLGVEGFTPQLYTPRNCIAPWRQPKLSGLGTEKGSWN